MPGPFTTPVASSVPVDIENRNTEVVLSVQDFVDWNSWPTLSQKPEFLLNGELDKITFYRDNNQIEINRMAEVSLTYDSNLNPITEIWKLYSLVDGTILLKTVTLTHTWVLNEITKTEMVTV